jgi:periplasmic protein TonB
MRRRLICVAVMVLLCTAPQSVIAQSYPKAFAFYAPRPSYPVLPNGQKPQGNGVFIVAINSKTGLVDSVSVKKSTGWAILDKAAIDALRRWKFRIPSKPTVDVPIQFVKRPNQSL